MKHDFRAGDLVRVDIANIFTRKGNVQRGVIMGIRDEKVEVRIVNNDLTPGKKFEIYLIPLSLAPLLIEDDEKDHGGLG